MTGRDTMGVGLMNPGEGQTVVAIARAAESDGDEEGTEEAESGESPQSQDPAGRLEQDTDSSASTVESGKVDQ